YDGAYFVLRLFFFFFFQAEDGIRDRNVTGVQTCALPIYSRCETGALTGGLPQHESSRDLVRRHVARRVQIAVGSDPPAVLTVGRSEERRVGKECRAGWGAYRGEEEERTWKLR